MSKASAFCSEDSDSISFYSAAQTGVKILVITDNVDWTAHQLLKKVFGIHEYKGIRGLCLDKDIDITALMVFSAGNRPK